MALMSFCPGCQAEHNFPDAVYGKKVQRRNCRKFFHAGQPEKGAHAEQPKLPEEPKETVATTTVLAGPPKDNKPRPRPRPRYDEDDKPRPRRNKDTSTATIFIVVGLLIGIPAVLTLLGVFVIFGSSLFAARRVALNEEIVADAMLEEARQQQDLIEQMDRARRAQEAQRAMQEALALQRLAQEQARQKAILDNLKKQQKTEPVVVPKKDPDPVVIADPPPMQKVPGNAFDLIALIDPVLDAVDNRKWEVVNGQLVCRKGNFVPRIQIPYIPPAEYDFIVTFSQPRLRNGISMIMPNPNGGSFYFFLGNFDGTRFGFGGMPGKEGKFNGGIQKNVQYTAIVQVRRTSVKALLGDTELMSLATDFRDLSADSWRRIPDTRLLAVACDDPTTFHQVRLVEITGTGKRTR